jgi:hypothetical protein
MSEIISKIYPKHNKRLQEVLFRLLWTKQFYYYDVHKWLFGGDEKSTTHRRTDSRNFSWQHLNNRHVISMPDKWEYPWYAAWDLAFHMASFVEIDPYFAKQHISLTRKLYAS